MDKKTLRIHPHGLQKDTTIALMFEPPRSRQLFKNQFPVVWKVLTFPVKNRSGSSIQYLPRFAFAYGQVDQNYIFHPTAWVEAQRGIVSNLSGATDQLRFDQSIHGDDSEHFACKNNSSGVVNLSIGLLNGKGADQRFQPTLVWTNVATGSDVTTKFTPKLTAHVTRDYQATEILRGEMETDAIWSYNLDKLSEMDDVTLWNFVEDDESGSFSISRVGF
ncbi:hypothetical protein RhiTH_011753 [Rhizoctonia solani]